MLVPIANRANMLANILTNNVGSNVGQHVGTVCEGLYMTASFPAIYFFYDGVITSHEHMKRFTCQGLYIYFTTLVAAIHYNKRAVIDSIKFEGYVCWKKNHRSSVFLKGRIYSTTLVAVICVWKVLCEMHESTFPFFHFLIWPFHNSNCSYS